MQINIAQLHVDKSVCPVWEFADTENLYDVLIRPIT